MKLEDQTRFYFLRRFESLGSDRHPFGCVALFVKDGEIYRGVSLCSPKDQFVKSVGRKIAERNARFLMRIVGLGRDGAGIGLDSSGAVRDSVMGIAGNDDLLFNLYCATALYDLDIVRGSTYCKAMKIGWDDLTRYEKSLFERDGVSGDSDGRNA